MQLWLVTNALSAVVLALLLQMMLMTLFATLVIFRVMGRDYDAAVIAAGFTGLGLGATPVAIANMDAVAMRYGWSATAFLVVPLIGAFFLDLLNAGIIQFFFALLT